MTDEERREKMRQYHREWRKRNPEKIKAAQRAYYERNTEARKENSRKWREHNREQDQKRNRLYYHTPRGKRNRRAWLEANRDRHAEHTRRSRDRHPNTWREYAKLYRKRRPDVVRAAMQRRRARKRNALGSFTPAEWRVLCAQYDHRCLCCGEREPVIQLVPDHVIPLAKGGSNFIANIQPLCIVCNSKKNVRIIDYRPVPYSGPVQLSLFDESHAVIGENIGDD